MKRLGIFTGRVYDEHYDLNKIKECCREISDETANNPNLVRFIYLTKHENCEGCFGCPASRSNKQQ